MGILDKYNDDIDYTVMSLEGLGNTLQIGDLSLIATENVFKAIGSTLVKLIEFFKEKIVSFLNFFKTDPDKFKKRMLGEFNDTLKDYSFLDTMNDPISIPSGFKGSLKDYSLFMIQTLTTLEDTLLESVDTHKDVLGNMINTKLDKRSYKYYNKVKKFDEVVSDEKDKYSKFFTSKSTNDISKLSKHFKNKEDISIFVNTMFTFKLDIATLDKLLDVTDLDGRIPAIRKLVQSEEVDKAVLKDISAGLYVLADNVEFLAIMLDQANVLYQVSKGIRDSVIDHI